MDRRVVAFLGLLSMVLVLLIPATALAQQTTPTPPAAATPTPAAPTATPAPATPTPVPASLAEVRAKFANWTQLDAVANGYVKDRFCISSSAGAMGFHAVKESLVDNQVDPLNPEALLLNEQGNVVGVEYITKGTPPAKLFPGVDTPQPFAANPAIAGTQALHTWFIANPSGIFAPFNPNLTCPTGTTPPAATPTARPPVTGDLSLPGGWGLYLAILGIGAVVVGLGIARRNASRS